MDDLRKEFEELLQNRCVDNCETNEDLYEYPDYVEAINAKLMPPVKSGVYISRWDLKIVGDVINASIAMDTRDRMYKMLMRSVHNKETMKQLLDAFSSLIDVKIKSYREMMQKYPSSTIIFEDKIKKAKNVKAYFNEVLDTYFPKN